MVDERQTVFKLLSFLLGYPEGDEFWTGVEEVRDCVDALRDSPAKHWLHKLMNTWLHCNPADLRRAYIQTFDFRENTCLYLTAHEYGDSRERGVALIELHRWFQKGGYEVATAELPDYLPGLFEFLSVKPPELQTEDLERRIAQVCHRILEHLGSSSFYDELFCAALSALPEVHYEGESIVFPKRQKADSDSMPYPMNFE